MKLLLTSILLLINFNFSTHKFYVSVTDIEYNENTTSLQIISRVFADDLEDVLTKRFGVPVVLLPDNESDNVEKWIKKYINQKFSLSIPNQEINLKFIGKRYEDDRVYLYIEAENISAFNQISVENLILTDLFEDQKNLVHLTHENKTKSSVLTLDKSSHTFMF
ncbi:DUF6702 family protein [Psychroflexus salis]|uniref:Uncharacterized protein n=1 Tax=Psychroflexus salis TaxID=1526574 RepID=A0A916ZR56_9FLAO|nr:DUF6702 family protein [Psychroflexus salis]GGE10097.1 hypothetical protein GCM10010831_09500 [Psychroflexus salis]